MHTKIYNRGHIYVSFKAQSWYHQKTIYKASAALTRFRPRFQSGYRCIPRFTIEGHEYVYFKAQSWYHQKTIYKASAALTRFLSRFQSGLSMHTKIYTIRGTHTCLLKPNLGIIRKLFTKRLQHLRDSSPVSNPVYRCIPRFTQ
jgi:hypothetical protein